MNVDEQVVVTVKLLTQDHQLLEGLLDDEEKQKTELIHTLSSGLLQIAQDFSPSGVASFHFKILASSLTKNKNKRSGGMTTKYMLQFSIVTKQQGVAITLVTAFSEPISVFPHSKYLKGNLKEPAYSRSKPRRKWKKSSLITGQQTPKQR